MTNVLWKKNSLEIWTCEQSLFLAYARTAKGILAKTASDKMALLVGRRAVLGRAKDSLGLN